MATFSKSKNPRALVLAALSAAGSEEVGQLGYTVRVAAEPDIA